MVAVKTKGFNLGIDTLSGRMLEQCQHMAKAIFAQLFKPNKVRIRYKIN